MTSSVVARASVLGGLPGGRQPEMNEVVTIPNKNATLNAITVRVWFIKSISEMNFPPGCCVAHHARINRGLAPCG
jgi:hypothetical protein